MCLETLMCATLPQMLYCSATGNAGAGAAHLRPEQDQGDDDLQRQAPQLVPAQAQPHHPAQRRLSARAPSFPASVGVSRTGPSIRDPTKLTSQQLGNQLTGLSELP